MVPDTSEIPILGSQAQPVPVPAGPGSAVSLSVHGFQAVDFMCYVTNLGGITALDVAFEVSTKNNPGADDWAVVQAQEISAGIATLADYVARKALAGPKAVVVTMQVRGLWMRPSFGVVGDAAGSAFYVTAIRRG